MILLADVGNSRIKWMLWDGVEARQRGQMSHPADKGTEWVVEQHWGTFLPPERAVIVSVAGSTVRAALADWINRAWQINAQFITSTTAAYGIRNAYTEPERLGADRWVAMVAARALIGAQCYIVDCGTAVTIDALAANGQHLGGVIVPGMRLMREALYRDTRQIPPEAGTPMLLARSTCDGVWGGAAYAVASAIDGIIQRMIEECGPGVCLLTGGDAEQVWPLLCRPYRIELDLVFVGLQIIARHS